MASRTVRARLDATAEADLELLLREGGSESEVVRAALDAARLGERVGTAPLSWRPLAAADLPLLARWLAEPRVRRWWNHDPVCVEADFGPSTRGEEPGEDLVVCLDGEPVGLVQRSAFADYAEDLSELTALVEVPDGAVELDYLLGEERFRGRGLGPRMIAAVAADTWVAYPGCPAILVPVVAANRASWRALEKAGFTRVAEGPMEPDNPVDDPHHVVYRLARPA